MLKRDVCNDEFLKKSPHDINKICNLLTNMKTHCEQVSEFLDLTKQNLISKPELLGNGLSFLQLKSVLLSSYLTNMVNIFLLKLNGKSIENDLTIERLIAIRTILEKIRPIDYKLRYQIDKLVKQAITAHGGNLEKQSSTDPISYKPNPNSLISQLANNDDSESADVSDEEKFTNKSNSTEKYVPPKISAVHYDEVDTTPERARKQAERARKRAINSSIVQDLKEEYLDIPIEITSISRAQQMYSKAQKERQEYEETYFTRLPITKAEKHRQKRLSTLGTLGSEITSFGGFHDDDQSNDKKKKSIGTNKKRKHASKKHKKGVKKCKFH